MFENYRVFETVFCGRPLKIETGKMCCLSNGNCLVHYGETSVLVNTVMSARPRDGIDFFPLSVDFEEKLYSVGRIPGSFLKREGRPSEQAILSSRCVDRPIRPLFPKDMRNDVAVTMTVMSVDEDCSPLIAGMIGTSVALSISDIPWNGPIGGVVLGMIDGEVVFNPTLAEREKTEMTVTLAGTKEKIVMIEAQGNEIDDEAMLDAIAKGHEVIKEIIAFVQSVKDEIGKEKIVFESKEVPEELFNAVYDFTVDRVKMALDTDDKNVRDANMKPIVDDMYEKFTDEENGVTKVLLDEVIYKVQKKVVRRWLLDEGKRVDGRGMDEIRPLAAEVAVLPRVHGSGMFTRGQTQVLTVATLGPLRDAQKIDGIDEIDQKRYMHQYNFPSYSVGETRPSRGPGRREIGHGALAEKALIAVLPTEEEFPYAIRLVSEVLSSNGSTSQASICGSSLALMDAGVPIKTPVAGISCGLITEGDRWMTMVDIQGLEDFYGDMDFKVGGTHKGITAIQVDIKNDGLTLEIIREAFEKTRKARLHILDDIMAPAIAEPRAEVSQYAPKQMSTQIEVDKIREVIGSGGKVIQKICAECQVQIDITEEGMVYILGVDINNVRRALDVVNTIAKDPEIGSIYKGKVTRIMDFGAFVEIAPGKEGLVHISKLAPERVAKVTDVVNEGDEVVVKVVEIDDRGRLNLSRKDALADMERARKQREGENA
ncbi:MAG: polyribonucleotide nucleotidyltransferase [Oscillospiraceae bacterium]|nr:polyribonucleotide nucleotidyltransferase [Oscillospiraceae bacterium]